MTGTADIKLAVDAGKPVRPVDRRVIGINVNYLMDGNGLFTAGRGLAAALKDLGVRSLRYPGGNKSDTYLWSQPPWDKPKPSLARIGRKEWPSGDAKLMLEDGTTFRNAPLDFDQFMEVCREIGAEPMICLAYDSIHEPSKDGSKVPTREQILETAVEWVRYANVRKGYGIKYWSLGNESYLWHGAASALEYAKDLALFSRAMKKVDPGIMLGANGPGRAENIGKLDEDAGNKEPWWKSVLETSPDAVDFLDIHTYPCWRWRGYEAYVASEPDFLADVNGGLEAVSRWAPAHAGRMRVLVTEANSADWTATQEDKKGWPHLNNLGHALVLFEMIGAHLLHPKVDMLNVWNTRWNHNRDEMPEELWDALDSNNEPNPTGHAIAAWGRHILDTMVGAESAGGLRIFASTSADRRRLSVFALNKTKSRVEARIELGNYAAGKGIHHAYAGKDPDDAAPAWLKPAPARISGPGLDVSLEPLSINVMTLET